MIDSRRPLFRDLGVVLILALMAVAPLLIFGLPGGDGAPFNLNWAKEFGAQFRDGKIYPRWIAGSFAGLGAPTFYFYPPLPFWWSSVIQTPFGPEDIPWRGLGTAAAGACLIGAAGFYLWARNFSTNRAAQVIGSAIYSIAPYQFLVNLHGRSAYAEYCALAIVPFVLLSAARASAGSRYAAFVVPIGYACLVVCHLPTTLILSPIIGMVPIFFAERRDLLSSCMRVWFGMVLGILLSAMYLLPALSLRDIIDEKMWWTGYVAYRQWFILGSEVSKTPAVNEFLNYLFAAILAAAMIALSIFAILKGKEKERRAEIAARRLAILALSVASFMCLALSKPIWQLMPILQNVQFPWRFFGLMEFAAATLIVQAADKTIGTVGPLRTTWLILWSAVAFGMLMCLWPMAAQYRVPARSAEGPITPAAKFGYEAPEYGTVWAPDWIMLPTYVGDTLIHTNLLRLGRETRQDLVSSGITIESWNPPREIVLSIKDAAGDVVQLPQFYFPIWRARVVRDGVFEGEVEIAPSKKFGLMELRLPKGENYRVLIDSVTLPVERLGYMISGATAVLYLALIALALKRSPKTMAP